MIQDILTVKIERTIYVNEEKAVSEIHHELLMSL